MGRRVCGEEWAAWEVVVAAVATTEDLLRISSTEIRGRRLRSSLGPAIRLECSSETTEVARTCSTRIWAGRWTIRSDLEVVVGEAWVVDSRERSVRSRLTCRDRQTGSTRHRIRQLNTTFT
uniref:(northern house mosquito) hypothetical protein n=1 Tax=Culex pipiens TaxID=7175 RepID=A0A8D8MCZ9_CULPI